MSSVEEETQKKILSVVNKLGHAPKRNLPLLSRSPNVQCSRAQKRPYSLLEAKSKGDKSDAVESSLSQAPPCRPWDRGDLISRLTTFKSMTWFAKPKVVDAVSCARKGWINVDMDIIACEVCGARLLFSNPASWNQQQIEKAALVFSLKLDNGHKLNCPWMDNACDERLVLFPPTPSTVLVEHYKERSSALLQLSALPLISALAIEIMRCPQMEQFLKVSIEVECGNLPSDSSLTDDLGNDGKALSADLYYQAHRILGLCGWEPCLLPYMVDCNNQSKQFTGANTSAPSSSNSGEGNNKLMVCKSYSHKRNTTDEQAISSSVEYDPNSTALDCKLCGARVGLWTFSTVPRPLQLVRLVGYTEVDSGRYLGRTDSVSKEPILAKGNTASLNLTIAGGPPPTRQNFRARISLPIIGRNLRAQFSSVSPPERHASEERCASDSGAEDRSESSQVEIGSNVSGRSPKAVDGAGTSCQVTGELNAQVVGDSTIFPGQSVGITNGEVENMSAAQCDCSSDKGAGGTAQSNFNNDTSSYIADPKKPFNKKMELDPIRLHRHFCPWIASTETTVPGWKQTLLALQKEKVFSLPESEDSPLTPSLIEVDDPITSIRRLFKSPSAKRARLIQ